MTRSHALTTLCLTGLLLVGCASRAPAPVSKDDTAMVTETAAPVMPDAPLQGYERAQAERAASAEAAGQWADAALAWEILSVLRPDDQQVRQRLESARRRIDTLANDRQAAAVAAHRRGDLEGAMQAYLDVLTLDPSRRIAADALRQIERDRTRRSVVGRFARPPVPRRNVEAEMAAAIEPSEPARAANSQREHATLLARQGDLDGAIQLLRDSPATRQDAAHRNLLADLYVQKAESLRQRQPELARQAVDAALALDRRHAGALALQAQLPKAAKGRNAKPVNPSASPR